MFRSVVIPFNPNIYSVIDGKNSSAAGSESSPSDKIDIFEKLGDRIYKFGMSFEIDEGMIHLLVLSISCLLVHFAPTC